MSRYLLDTSVIIDYSRNREPAVSQIDRIREIAEVGVCPINIAEFFTGLPLELRPIWRRTFAAMRFWPISRKAAILAGEYRYDYARRGIALSLPDALIAAVAVERDAVLLTGNVKHFPMPELKLMSLGE